MRVPFAEPIDEDILYPETDGKPMAENTLQFQWIVAIEGGLDAQFRDDRDVFVAGDLFWYPVKGQPSNVMAPDILVAFGRPKGHRRSYRQWRENDVAPQVVFEVKSPGNTRQEMEGKFEFYDRYGVDEYYVYDPDNIILTGYLRRNGVLEEIEEMDGWVSPRLQIRFDMAGPVLVIWGRDGQRFLTFVEMAADREKALKLVEKERRKAKKEQQTAEKERLKAEQERQTAEKERLTAEKERQIAEKERQTAEKERQLRKEMQTQVEKMAARLRDMGIDPNQ